MDSFFNNIFRKESTIGAREGRSLGGQKAGQVLSKSIPSQGPLGCAIEKSSDGREYAIVSSVINGSPAASAGLQRGDIICYPDSNGTYEISYNDFIEMANSAVRPLVFDVRRIVTDSSQSSGTSADAYVRKQAMIDAAEQRQQANKSKFTLKKPSSSTEMNRNTDNTSEIASEETRRAISIAKGIETERVNELGFNLYESTKASGEQGRSAVSSIDAGNKVSSLSSNIVQPRALVYTINPAFETAFSLLVSSPDANQSISIIRKVTLNALTKGQVDDEETASKFRRIRLSNPKINQYVTNVAGAVDILISFGFLLCEEEGQDGPSLIFPPGESGPDWINNALDVLETYEIEHR